MDRERFFDAGIEAGFPYEFVAHWLEVYLDVAEDNEVTPTMFVSYLERKAA